MSYFWILPRDLRGQNSSPSFITHHPMKVPPDQELLRNHRAAVPLQGAEGHEEGGLAPGLRLPQQGTSVVQVQEGMAMRCKCASSVRVACVVFSSFMTCCRIASESASGIVSRVIHVLRVPIFCLRHCFWTRLWRHPCSVCSFQLQKDRFWAWVEETPQAEEEEEDEEDESSSSSTSSASASASASASGSVRAPTPENKVARSTVSEKEKEKHKKKEKDNEKGAEAEGEAVGQQKTELAAAAQVVVVEGGAKGKQGKVKQGKQKGKEKRKEKAGGVGQVAFKIEGAPGPQKSVPAKTTRFEHYQESTQFMNDMQALFTSHVLCFQCLQQCFQRRPPPPFGYPHVLRPVPGPHHHHHDHYHHQDHPYELHHQPQEGMSEPEPDPYVKMEQEWK